MIERRGRNPKSIDLDMSFTEAVARFAQTDPKELFDDDDGPVPLVEHGDTGDRFLIYHGKNGVEIELRVESDTFWATQRQMADAFGVSIQNISLHLQNIFKEGELDEQSVVKESLITGRDGKGYQTKIYDLNALISVGYRVGGKSGTQFRIWATGKLLQYMTRGFVVDSDRLKKAGNQDRIRELREIVADIRAEEANVYAELRRICAMCKDYDPKAQESREFYSKMQAKLFWAVTTHTPAMVMKGRADADEPDMGLHTWKGVEITQADAVVAKNYLSVRELRELNRLTIILLDIFDDQLEIGRLTLMDEANRLLDAQLRQLGRTVLNHGGRVSHQIAEDHAKREYKKFDQQRRMLRARQTEKELAELKTVSRKLPRAGRSRED